MVSFFEKANENLFSPLSRKYKTVYAFSLISLYHILKTQQKDIRKSDLYSFLKTNGNELISNFSVNKDKLEDKEGEEVVLDSNEQTNLVDEEVINNKINYIIRKLSKCGWFYLSRDNDSNIEKIIVPSYSIELMRVMNDITSSTNSYLPLVHQTYSEIKLVDDNYEDDYIYQALANARRNADTLHMNVILLKQQIQVFGRRLQGVFDPNVVLEQHFDGYRVDVSNKYYHPMKTFDSLGLYSLPTVNILKKWINTPRIITQIVKAAKVLPEYRGFELKDITSNVLKMIQETIDIFSNLVEVFNDIDRENAEYIKTVQSRVNYLSSSDKTIKGKIDNIIINLAKEIKENPYKDYDKLENLNFAKQTINLSRHGFLDSSSLQLPYKREYADEGEPLYFDDDFSDGDRTIALNDFLERKTNRFSNEVITEFLNNNMENSNEIETKDLDITDLNSVIMHIFGINAALNGKIPFKVKKIANCIEKNNWYMPLYSFKKK